MIAGGYHSVSIDVQDLGNKAYQRFRCLLELGCHLESVNLFDSSFMIHSIIIY